MKRGLIALSIVMIVALLCAFSSQPVDVNTTAGQHADEPARKPPLLDPESNPHAVLTRAFKRSGWTQYQSSVHASRMLGHDVDLIGQALQDFNAPPPGVAGVPLLSPDSDPHALLTSIFKNSGWSQLEASRFASAMLGHPLNPDNERCWLSLVDIIYCDSEHVMRTKSAYLNGACWTADPPGPDVSLEQCIQNFMACQTGGHVHWLKLKIDNACFGLTDGQCVYVRIQPPDWVDCHAAQTFPACNCFEELDPTDCASIEYLCCPADGTGPCSATCPSGCN